LVSDIRAGDGKIANLFFTVYVLYNMQYTIYADVNQTTNLSTFSLHFVCFKVGFFMFVFQNCFICCPSDSTMSEDAGL
jgi:hypothetical protein